MQYLPVSWRVDGQWVLLVGGGEIALRKARLLARAGARLRVVAPEIEPALAELVDQTGGERLASVFEAAQLDGVQLALAATDSDSVNRAVSEAAQARGIPVNVVDNPSLCTFIFPAIVDRDPLLVSISSGGASPVLARWLRSRIESWLPARWGELASLMGSRRKALAEKLPAVSARRLFWENVLDGPVVEQSLAGRSQEAGALLDKAIEQADAATLSEGEVYLVGAGPGDPDLLTFRALRLLQKADVVLYDRLVSPGVLELARRDAELVYVGKKRSEHVIPQNEINELLVQYARQGKKVCRLKGGDPFIFGRGGEEIERVVAEGIRFQVVPGITAASGCAAYAGIPLTHRDHAQSVRFVTGHRKENGELNLPWAALTTPNETLVFYMGLVSLPDISRGLIAAGKSPQTPAALVSQGTTADQQVVTGTLENLPALAAQAQLPAPTLLIIGDVVALHAQLNWFG
ncbi:uroporphyrin-III C-methyltransferase [Isoalcanivorax pacificus W11-5]|uniref:Siroheme synthase n=1 Tax=Isoalcanivorax pacificus W11-5 TaxID=391936 RepID=A0A0B4XPM2_9GAMM|nr:siroheme synthase CysG [Isoalcanivorax pacificus]AJD48212.1 uroporphyrin-III C-methyltransferase [Isoalcanivorax pacificus W11-5]